MAPKNFRAMAQTHIFGGFEPWLKPTFDMQIFTCQNESDGPFYLPSSSPCSSVLGKHDTQYDIVAA